MFHISPVSWMRRAAIILTAGCAALACMAAEGTSETAEKLKVGTTLENLQAAYNGESNASAKYAVFAKKADEEGYKKVAVLFRAASRAEKVHAETHAKAIEKMGGKPQADIKTPEPKSTKENLQAAIEGESYERDVMYPEFLKKARQEAATDAVRSFNYAKAAEAEHAKFYTEAVGALDEWKAAGASFYVCPTCGKTVTKADFEKCPVCFTPNEKFEKIS